MDEIETRLKDTSEKCVEAYCVWKEKKNDAELRGGLQEAVHELRKVSARLEIEIATSERDQMTQKPIPVPPHRSARRKGGVANGGDGNNMQEPSAPISAPPENTGPKMEIKRRRRTVRKPSDSAGE
jgi:hypothetical protein|tara:strand:+ start:292 stop:669 length:378 start_codon:yes stop_codon:yes gene_type:complete